MLLYDLRKVQALVHVDSDVVGADAYTPVRHVNHGGKMEVVRAECLRRRLGLKLWLRMGGRALLLKLYAIRHQLYAGIHP